MAKLSTTDISLMTVRNTIGCNSLNLIDIVKHPNVNPWSRYGPINSPTLPRTDTIRNGTSRWKVVAGSAGLTPKTLQPDPPTGTVSSPYCLGDFRGYNHSAPAFSSWIDHITFIGAPEGTDVYVGGAETTGTFTVYIQLPEIPTEAFTGVADTVYIDKGIYGTTSYGNNVGSKAITMADAGTIISITCTIPASDVPSGGFSVSYDYYVRLGDCYFISAANNKITVDVYKQLISDPNDPNQWRNCTISNPQSLSTVDVRWTSWKHFRGTGEETYTRVIIEGLVVAAQPGINFYYSTDNITWTFYRKIMPSSYTYPFNLDFSLSGVTNAEFWKIESGQLE